MHTRRSPKARIAIPFIPAQLIPALAALALLSLAGCGGSSHSNSQAAPDPFLGGVANGLGGSFKDSANGTSGTFYSNFIAPQNFQPLTLIITPMGAAAPLAASMTYK